jgi:hypothetical protein
MRDTKPTPDLTSLNDDYELVGELTGSGDARSYIATRKGESTKRRGDQTGVVITVVTTPEGDEANALTHLAADTQLLARMSHRRLVPIIEGRWIGDDAYAVVTQRITDPSLAQVLSTGEKFSNPRIAAILREVNGLLEWAREQKVVHRNITPDRLFLEPKTDRVRISFAIAPIRRLAQNTDADDDARIIARLAMAMLTGDVDPQAYEGKSLEELRPDLPEQLGEATLALLAENRTGQPVDVAAYLALIGMADPLFEGETERERIRAEILEEQRAEREKLAAERAAFEGEMATARANFEREMELEREKLARHQSELERAAEAERARVEKERAELERAVTAERDKLQRALTEERAALVATRAELERAAAEQRAEVERAAALDRQRIEELRVEIRRLGELEVEKKRQTALEDITDDTATYDRAELATPMFIPPVNVPLKELVFDDDTPVMRDDEITFTPAREEIVPIEIPAEPERDSRETAQSRKRWILGGAIAAGLAIAVASAVVVGSRGNSTPVVAKPAVRAPVVSAPVVSAPVAAAPTPAVPLPSQPIVDSAAGVVGRPLDSTTKVAATGAAGNKVGATGAAGNKVAATGAAGATGAAAPAAPPKPRRVVPDSVGRVRRELSTTPNRRDTGAPRRAMSLSESIFTIPGAPPIRRDTSPRPDTSTPPPE